MAANAGRNISQDRSILMDKLFAVLFEDDEMLAVNKPSDLVCHPTKGDVYSSLISRVRLYLGEGSTPHLVNRLDRETSGVVVVAKSPFMAGKLAGLWERRMVEKQYVAIVHGHVRDDRGSVEAPLGRDETSHVAIKDCVRPDGSAARTDFTVIRRFTRAEGDFTLLQVQPQTGRKHQIRIHLAHVGHPLVGEKLYGADENLYLALVNDRLSDDDRRRLILPCQALHAESVRFNWRLKDFHFVARPEPWLEAFHAAGIVCGAPPPDPFAAGAIP